MHGRRSRLRSEPNRCPHAELRAFTIWAGHDEGPIQAITEVRDRRQRDGYDLDSGSPEELASFIGDEYEPGRSSEQKASRTDWVTGAHGTTGPDRIVVACAINAVEWNTALAP